jgi:hypothetical protein
MERGIIGLDEFGFVNDGGARTSLGRDAGGSAKIDDLGDRQGRAGRISGNHAPRPPAREGHDRGFLPVMIGFNQKASRAVNLFVYKASTNAYS